MLENHGHVVATKLPQLGVVHVGDDLAGHLHGTFGRSPQTVDHADERGLSGPREAHDDEGLPLRDFKADVDNSRRAERGKIFSRLPCLESFDHFSFVFTENLVQMGCSNQIHVVRHLSDGRWSQKG